MKPRLHIRFAILAGVPARAHAETHDSFQAVYNANHVFELRDAVEHSTAPLFWLDGRGWLAYRTVRRTDLSRRTFTGFLDQTASR